VGAVLGGRTFYRSGAFSLADPGDEFSGICREARCVLGHNLVLHDLRVLEEKFPGHPLLQLPVIDTLALSPLAFPENPYHRLVKDYKLVSESLNDPVADARQAGLLFADEFKSFQGLRDTEPGVFELLEFLLTRSNRDREPCCSGMVMLFEALGRAKPSEERALRLCREIFRKHGCSSVPVDAALTRTHPERMALAYAAAWLRVAGSNSVLPPWVRMQHPLVGKLIQRWREAPCAAEGCAYCRRVHDAGAQLQSFFGMEDFRPLPRNREGGSLQRDIIEAGMRNESLLAILPTGGGKSICFQLPALVRNYRRGVLTIVISPLQALMKDQVDGLTRRTGTPFAAALYGLLTPPERGDVLRRIRLGDIAVLYVSPEQLRNRSFREAIAQREIGCWVFDEAHCLSKWGHDFRPDYLYAGRFIREFSRSEEGKLPAIACFTATAKRDVKEEILAYFRSETGIELALYEGGVERDNLKFEVQTITGHGKHERVHDLLSDHLRGDESGSAIVFRATREATRESAEYLKTKGWRAEYFHAALTAPEKKRVQDEFLAGAIQVICATNAFGMGIDKEDVRLVVHADTPGSLENYLQEAGRAGRDGKLAECVLLYAEDDCEHQFRMGAFSQLTRKDIAQILRAVRRAMRGDRQEVVITSGEILRDEEIETSISLEETNADTKVRTAISWLERAGLIQRDENVTSVFQARLLVRDLKEAESKMASLNLSQQERALWLAILRQFMNASPTDNLTVDQIAGLAEFVSYAQNRSPNSSGTPGELKEEPIAYREGANPDYVSAKILRILRNMAETGLMKRDMLLNAFVRHKVADHSRVRLERFLQVDRALVDLLALEEPNPEGWMPLSLRLLNQRMLDNGFETSTELLRQLLKSLSEDGRGFAGSHGSLDLRFIGRDSYRVRVRRNWKSISELAEKRRRVAVLVLDHLLGKVHPGTPPRADQLVEFSFEELRELIERDLLLRSELKDIDMALERALMYLHEQRIIVLQQGLAVFRSAMTIRLRPESRGEKYKASDYQPLEHHYKERIFQVHVMSEYAQRGLGRIREALDLVLAYFSLEKADFIRRYLGMKPELLQHATTARSFQRIVTDLGNRAQIKVVTAPANRNMLILAGPGSGKTKTVVHRCAYLLRVKRVRPQSILVCCFNRHAAHELRRRLAELGGEDARGVTVLTYHSLAMRLLGYSFAGRKHPEVAGPNLEEVIPKAVALLQGNSTTLGLEPDELRDRLLSGYQYILVDEYQDIDEPQYELISALAGRTMEDADLKLSILAVGDDDQNIYGFRGANVGFIRRFQRDYDAEAHYLVENYRSTRHIIDASNALIAGNSDRMKTRHPIRIDAGRERQLAGGDLAEKDMLAGGKVQVIEVEDDFGQARAVIEEIQRLKGLGVTDWSGIAVLSRSHRELAQVRVLAEQENIPIRWWADRGKIPHLHQVREIARFLKHLSGMKNSPVRAGELIRLAEAVPDARGNHWMRFLERALEGWREESGNAEIPAHEALEFLYEECAESRRDFSFGEGVTLSTVHAAKGTEHDHVLLVGSWRLAGSRTEREELRRIFYVGMTRARRTLAMIEQRGVGRSVLEGLGGAGVLRRRAGAGTAGRSGNDDSYRNTVNYGILGLEDIHLGYPKRFRENHPLHAALAGLRPGDKLVMRADDAHLGLYDLDGQCVGRLSRKAAAEWGRRLNRIREVRVLALVRRTVGQEAISDPQDYCVEEWEIPVGEVLFEEESGCGKTAEGR
jgi:ATP-dependent DNA helicase RecQ